MTKFIKLTAVFAIIIFLFSSGCDIFNNKIEPNEEFTKIISNTNFSSDFYAEDIIQSADNGFIILGSLHNENNAYVWQTPYIIKLDENGTVLWENSVASPYVNPVGKILHLGSEYFFFTMHETTLETHFLKINETNGSTELVAGFDNVTYPTAVSQNSDNTILVQGYNNFARQTILSKINENFTVEWTQSYPLNEDAEEILVNHISKTGKQYPFFNGEADDYYFFNGLYNYTFSLVFINKSTGEFQGVMNGYRYSGAVSSAINLTGNNYAFSVFTHNENYLFPADQIDGSSVSSIEGITTTPIPELQDDAKVAVNTFTINDMDFTIFAAGTKNNQIKLYFYNEGTSDLFLYKEIADKNPIEVKQIIKTTEGGIAILGRTFVSGQFSRIYVSKISPENLQ